MQSEIAPASWPQPERSRNVSMTRERVIADEKHMRVLCIGRKERGFSLLLSYLTKQGCECELASSYSEGARRFADRPFDLVLCNGEPGIETLLDVVKGSTASVFRAHAVENSCWWVPAIRQGKNCFGMPALRPNEFAETLRSMSDQTRQELGA